MTNLWKLIMMLGIVFVLTYDAKSGTIERFIEQPVAAAAAAQKTPGRYGDADRYHNLQFPKPT
ncbi:hypothetical protein [Dishui Lake phycodnavirus 4]|nr:hypothetical protein [Dishui Lake phycodnavirus 4]